MTNDATQMTNDQWREANDQ